MDLIFFANDVYDSLAGILHTLFSAIYSDFSISVRISLNAVFHFFIVFYAFMAIRTGLIGSLLSIGRTILLLLVTFNLSFNFDEFKTWIYDFIMKFPVHIAGFFINSTISSVIPGFKAPGSFNTSELFAKLANVLLTRANSAWDTAPMLKVFPPGTAIYLFFIVILIFILYIGYWLIQFNFLIQASIYMIIGVPVLLLASFRQTQSIFFEWLRAVVTLMLYPVFASIVIFLILNVLLPLTEDVKNIFNDSQAALSATGTVFCILVFGIYAMRQIPSMAAVMTRGHMTAGNPVQFSRQAASQLAGIAGGAVGKIVAGGVKSAKAASYVKGKVSGGGKGDDEKKEDGSGPPGSRLITGADDLNNNIQKMPSERPQIGYDPNQASTHFSYGGTKSETNSASGANESSNPFQSVPKPVSSGSDFKSSGSASQAEVTPKTGQVIELKPQTTGNNKAPGPTYGAPGEKSLPEQIRPELQKEQHAGSQSEQHAHNATHQDNREGEKATHFNDSSDNRSEMSRQEQLNAYSEDRTQVNADTYGSQSNNLNSQVSNQQSSFQTNESQNNDQSRTAGTQPAPGNVKRSPVSGQQTQPKETIRTEKKTQKKTSQPEPKVIKEGGSAPVLPKVSPPKPPPSPQTPSPRGSTHVPKIDIKD